MHDARCHDDAPRIALYSHDTMGVGHFRRNLLLAQAFAAPPLAASVLMLSGLRDSGRFALPDGVDVLTLPGWRKLPTGGYVPRALKSEAKAHAALRADIISAALASFRPDLLVVDNVPRGAEGELTPVLRDLRRTGRTRVVLGLRDILDDAATVRRQWWRRRNYEAMRRYFDAVWVYGDPRICRPAEEYGFGSGLGERVEHLGYLDPLGRLALVLNETPQAAEEPFILCVAGGGEDGAALTEAFVKTAMPAGRRGVIVLGAMAPTDVRARVRTAAATRPDMTVLDAVSEGMLLMARAERIVCMGGYNTTIEALALAKPTLIVPRVAPRREQAIRAERLAALGLVETIDPATLVPATLAERLVRPFRPSGNPLDFGGLDRAVSCAAALIGRPERHLANVA